MPVHRKRVFLLLGIALPLLLVGYLSIGVDSGPAITPTRVAQIQRGMTLKDVDTILGGEGRVTMSGAMDTYIWVGNEGSVLVWFDEKGLAYDFGFLFKESHWSMMCERVRQLIGFSNSIQCQCP